MDEKGGDSDDENVDYSDVMEVVTSYKCRFCDFTSTRPTDINTHVKHMHRKNMRKPPRRDVATSGVDVEMAVQAVQVDIQKMIASNPGAQHTSMEVEQVHMTDTSNSMQDQHLSIHLDEATVANNGTVIQQIQERRDDSTIPLLTLSDGKSIQIITSSATGADVTGAISVVDSHGTIVMNNESGGEEHAGTLVIQPQMAEACPDNVQFVQSVQPEDEITYEIVGAHDGGGNGIGEAMTEEGDAANSNKDLFLCGQCSLGFVSIDDCKLHMVQDHGFSVSATVETSSQDHMAQDKGGKTDAGTQCAPRKKPGRKPKSMKEPKPEDDSPENSEILNDLEIEQSKEQVEFETTASGRRVKKSRTLTDGNYYIGKRKEMHKASMEIKQQYYKKCPLKCGAKFCSDDGVQLHMKCHKQIRKSKIETEPEVDGEVNVTTVEDENEKEGEWELIVLKAQYACPECNEDFDRWPPLRIHLYKAHMIDCDMQTCDVCQFKTDCVGKLLIHREIHSEERPYRCSICNKGFRQVAQQLNHEATSHTENEVLSCEEMKNKKKRRWTLPAKCHICDHMFVSSKSLKLHISIVHEKVKPFQCPYCPHQSARKAMLDMHVRIHTGDKPHKCDFCNYSTSDHNSLRRHRMRHTGEKPYKCMYCSFSCIQSISLKSHLQNKHPNAKDSFACKLCPFRSVNQDKYAQHMADHEKGLIEVVTQPKVQHERTTNTNARMEPIVPQLEVNNSSVVIQSGDQVHEIQLGQPVDTINAAALAGLGLQSTDQSRQQESINAAQLIYSALSAMSQGIAPDADINQSNMNVENNENRDGNTTTITFQLPEGSNPSNMLTSFQTEDGESVYVVQENAPPQITESPVVAEIQVGDEEVKAQVLTAGTVEQSPPHVEVNTQVLTAINTNGVISHVLTEQQMTQ